MVVSIPIIFWYFVRGLDIVDLRQEVVRLVGRLGVSAHEIDPLVSDDELEAVSMGGSIVGLVARKMSILRPTTDRHEGFVRYIDWHRPDRHIDWQHEGF
jgi:hypothetical protein